MGPVVKKPRFQPPTTTPRQAFQSPAIAKSGQENVKIDKGSSLKYTVYFFLWRYESNNRKEIDSLIFYVPLRYERNNRHAHCMKVVLLSFLTV